MDSEALFQCVSNPKTFGSSIFEDRRENCESWSKVLKNEVYNVGGHIQRRFILRPRGP